MIDEYSSSARRSSGSERMALQLDSGVLADLSVCVWNGILSGSEQREKHTHDIVRWQVLNWKTASNLDLDSIGAGFNKLRGFRAGILETTTRTPVRNKCAPNMPGRLQNSRISQLNYALSTIKSGKCMRALVLSVLIALIGSNAPKGFCQREREFQKVRSTKLCLSCKNKNACFIRGFLNNSAERPGNIISTRFLPAVFEYGDEVYLTLEL